MLHTQDFSDAAESDHLKRLATTAFGLASDANLAAVASHNMIGLRSDSVLVSRRLDCRTYFVQDMRDGFGKSGGVSRAEKGEQIKIARGIMEHIGAPVAEILQETVLREKLVPPG